MQTMSSLEQSIAHSGVLAGLLISRDDVTTLARLLDDVGTTLSVDPMAASSLLERAGGLVADMLGSHKDGGAGEAAEGGMAPWQIRRVRAHIEDHLQEPLPINLLSQMVRLSSSYFSRAFKVSFGCSPHSYILRRRIERAKFLMQSSDEPLAQVALGCGLSDQAHLSRIFRRYVGCTPSGWRRNVRT